MRGKPIQEVLFQHIKEILPVGVSLVDVISGLLHISPDSAYRRIRGETPLVLNEAQVLCHHFHLSLDQLLQFQNHSVVFQSVQIDNAGYTFENYLLGILENLKQIAACRQKQALYLSKDIPFFHHFSFKPLFAFRYFFWMKSILQHPDFTALPFSMHCLPPAVEKLGKEILQLYNAIPSIEIWNTECVNSCIAQVEYYREAGYIESDSDVEAIYEALKQTIEHVKNQAEAGCKYLPHEKPDVKKPNFDLYFNRVVLGDNTIMVLADGKKILYLNYDVLNYMVTRDEAFCNDTYAKLQLLMRRATILSNVSEKQRHIFFNMLLKKIPQHPKRASLNVAT